MIKLGYKRRNEVRLLVENFLAIGLGRDEITQVAIKPRLEYGQPHTDRRAQ